MTTTQAPGSYYDFGGLSQLRAEASANNAAGGETINKVAAEFETAFYQMLFDAMKKALDQHAFKASFFYIKLQLGEPIDHRLEKAINELKGTKTIISPYVLADNKRFKPNSLEGDSEAIRLL